MEGSAATSPGGFVGNNRNRGNSETVRMLIADLRSDNSKIRRRARNALMDIGEPAVAPLLEALGSRDELLRREAAKTLSQISSATAVPVWISTLEDQDCDLRWYATEGLIAAGDAGLVPLLRALEHQPDSVWFRAGAHRVLSHMLGGDLVDILGPVLLALEDVEPALGARVAAFEALSRLGASVAAGQREGKGLGRSSRSAYGEDKRIQSW